MIDLPQRADIALWKNENGEWQGALQDYEGEIPANLAAICDNWIRLRLPVPLP